MEYYHQVTVSYQDTDQDRTMNAFAHMMILCKVKKVFSSSKILNNIEERMT